MGGRATEGLLPSFPIKALSQFRVQSLLGGGGFAHVVLARDEAGAEWALKLIPAPGATSLADVETVAMLLNEARIHMLVSDEPSVLPCLEAFKAEYVAEGPSGGPVTYMAVLRMPVAACSAEEWLFTAQPPPAGCQRPAQADEHEILGVWLQMANAVHRCHARGVTHKDIKLPNFLMDRMGKVQLMDFGLAQLEGVTPRQIAGTPWTMSPAGFKQSDDGRAGDWWSLGVVLYQLLQGGAWPFKQCWWPWQKGGGRAMEKAIRRAVLAGRIAFKSGQAVSEPLKSLIRGLLQPDPNRRWQMRQVLACPVVTPELLRGLATKVPDLAEDMAALLELQQRVRGVQALGSAAAASARAPHSGTGPAAAAIASGLFGHMHVMSVPQLHVPHLPQLLGRPAGGDGSGHAPLLGPEGAEAGLAGRGGGSESTAHGGRAVRVEDLIVMDGSTSSPQPSPRGRGNGRGSPAGALRPVVSLAGSSGGAVSAFGRHNAAAISANSEAGSDAAARSGPLPAGSLDHAFSGATSTHSRSYPRLSHDRHSRTSLQELFGAVGGGLPQSHPKEQLLHHRPLSGDALGGVLLGSAGDVHHLAARGGAGSGIFPRRSFPGQAAAPADAAGAGLDDALLPSSWVPPPPEEIAAAAAGTGGRSSRTSSAILSAAGRPLAAAAAALVAAGRLGDEAGQGGGLLARIKRMFTSCLLHRPGVKHDGYDAYDALPGAEGRAV